MSQRLIDPSSMAWRHLKKRKIILLLLSSLVALSLVQAMTPVAAMVFSCGVTILAAVLRPRMRWGQPWWGVAGWIVGCFIGTGATMTHHIQQGVSHTSWERGLLVALLALTGGLVGRSLTPSQAAEDGLSMGEVLRSTSGLFTGLFGVIVASTFVMYGLDQARVTSSRLSTSLTIIVLCLAAPGWLSLNLKKRREGS